VKTNFVQLFGNKLAEFLIFFSTVEQNRYTTDSPILILPGRTVVLQIISKKLEVSGKDQVQIYSENKIRFAVGLRGFHQYI
jgi:hypothetical protein